MVLTSFLIGYEYSPFEEGHSLIGNFDKHSEVSEERLIPGRLCKDDSTTQ